MAVDRPGDGLRLCVSAALVRVACRRKYGNIWCAARSHYWHVDVAIRAAWPASAALSHPGGPPICNTFCGVLPPDFTPLCKTVQAASHGLRLVPILLSVLKG